MPMTPADAKRIETKLDQLLADVGRMLLIEERQKQDWRRMKAIEERLEKVEAKAAKTAQDLEQWINRGVGAWALAATVFAGLKYWPATQPPEAPRLPVPAISAPSTH